jgi:uncharacterized phage infection (PIP) family protein YhgE
MWYRLNLSIRPTEPTLDKGFEKTFQYALEYKQAGNVSRIGYIFNKSDAESLLQLVYNVPAQAPQQTPAPQVAAQPVQPAQPVPDDSERLRQGITSVSTQISTIVQGLNAADPAQKNVIDQLKKQQTSLNNLLQQTKTAETKKHFKR